MTGRQSYVRFRVEGSGFRFRVYGLRFPSGNLIVDMFLTVSVSDGSEPDAKGALRIKIGLLRVYYATVGTRWNPEETCSELFRLLYYFYIM